MWSRLKRNFNRRGFSYLLSSVLFKPFERYLHLHITPADYNSPIPNLGDLKDDVFEKVHGSAGLDWNVPEQLLLLDRFKEYLVEFQPSPNVGLSLVDAFVLYAMVRSRKPGIMIEVGSGESTKVALAALAWNAKEGNLADFYAIEPYPSQPLKNIVMERFHLLKKPVQDVDIELPRTADILFIDSSHVSKIGSDVNFLMLDVVPQMKCGSVIHWHDILIPGDYWKDWVRENRTFWNESYMLHTFMLFNHAFKILWASHYLQLFHREELQSAFPFFKPNRHRLTSFWVTKTI
jgi:hypothetical protein